MSSKIVVQKPAEQQTEIKKSSAQAPLADKAALKPQIRTPLELKRLTNRLLTAPETVTSGEFAMLTGVIGLRSALMLLDQGKRNKGKAEATDITSDTTPKESQNLPAASRDSSIQQASPSTHQSEVSAQPVSAQAAKPEKAEKTSPKTEKDNRNATEFKKGVEGKLSPLTKAEASADATLKGKLEAQAEAKSGAKPEGKAGAKAEAKSGAKQETKPDGKTAAKPAPARPKSAASGPLSANLPLQARKAPAKAPVVNIKGDNPGSVIQQLGSIAPSEIVEAYTQAVNVSGGALEQQRQQAEKALPAIPTPTGIAPGKDTEAADSPKQAAAGPVPASELPVFQSGKKGGDTSTGMVSFPQSPEEADPDQIMAEASRFAATPPEIGLTGEADPSQVESHQAEATQHMQTVQDSELEQTRQDFGEDRILPKPDDAILKSGLAIRSVAPPAFQLKSTGVIPPDVAGYLNPQLDGPLQTYMENSQAEYQKGKEPFDSGLTTAKSDTKAEVERLKTEASEKQRSEQAAVKAEVSGYRSQWQEEIKATSGEFDREAGTAAAEKNKEISGIKDEKEGEVKKKLSEAESESRQEYKTTKTQAEEKQKEGENEGEQTKKKAKNPWEWIKEKGRQAGEAIQKGMNFLFTQLRKAVKTIFDKAKQAVVGLIEAGRKLIVSAIKGFGNVLKGLANKIFARFPGIAKKINGWIDRAVNKAVQAVNAAASLLKKGVSTALDFMGNTVDKLFAGVQSLYNGILSGIGKFLNGDFKVNFGKFLEIAQISAEIAAAFATGGGSILVQIGIWLTSTLPKLLRQANSVMTVVNTLRNFKVQNVKQFLNPSGMGGFLVKGLFGELQPLQTGQEDDKEKDKDAGKAPKSGGQEKGLMKVLQLLEGVFGILQKTVGKVAGAINKALPVINISDKSWFNPFSMAYAGAVQALEVVKNPAEALNEGADKLKEAAGGFFRGIREKVTEAAGGIKAKVQLLGKPAQLMTVLANKGVDMVLNFIITNPPSALIKAVFKGIEAVAGQSLVDLIRQHIPFADKLINKIAASGPVQGLMQPLQGPVEKVGGMIDEATGGATSLVDEAESQASSVFGNGTKLLANLSGTSGGGSKDSPGQKEEQKAGGKAGAAKKEASGGFLGTVKGGVHSRLLAFGKQLLKSGVNLAVAGAGKLKNAISGLLVNFKIGKESHKLWVEKSGSGHVVMMASDPQTLAVIIKGFETRIEKLKEYGAGNDGSEIEDPGIDIGALIIQLKGLHTKIGATPLDKLASSDLNTVVPVIKAIEQYLEKKEGAAEGTGEPNQQAESLWRPTEKLADLWSKGKLKVHYEKHGDEFGAKSSKEYSNMAYEFGTSKSDSIIQVNDGAFIYRYEPSTKSIFVGTGIGGKIKSFYKWDGRSDDAVILMLKGKGLIE
ncbi:hypothetical protein [Paenibacillus sp. P32E]|uniref:hypothetical protein n=1 Tax=Paenibacillus sp. P32E TaxID=1349434 RepID=UPI00093EA427|nr:hypothetical protein [Paenibacillus sp. P32E]OKP89721.1 hypothetical protein A3848_13080 [Paenibacillus sp. P32E]